MISLNKNKRVIIIGKENNIHLTYSMDFIIEQ